MPRTNKDWTPDPEQMKLWPEISGNTINGLGEAEFARPRPIYWHPPESTPHGRLQLYMAGRRKPDHPKVREVRAYNEEMQAVQISPLATQRVEQSPEAWTAQVKQVGLQSGADLVGIAVMRSEWLYEGKPDIPERYIIVIGVAHDYEQMKTAPEITASCEVSRQYTRGDLAAKGISSWIQEHGHPARPSSTSPCTITLIPPALACGFGELGKHGSIIHRELGASFRLAAVLTDLPLIADAPDHFGVDDFCSSCRTCIDACPPDAMYERKQVVRGALKWYVNFDKCLPYFNEHHGCGICVVACPWSRPAAAPKLLLSLARRRERAQAAE